MERDHMSELVTDLIKRAMLDNTVMSRIEKGKFKGAGLWLNYKTGYMLISCNIAINAIAGCNLYTGFDLWRCYKIKKSPLIGVFCAGLIS